MLFERIIAFFTAVLTVITGFLGIDTDKDKRVMSIHEYSQGRIARSVRSYQAMEAERLADEMAQHFWPMIGTANHMAFQAIDDAVEMMRETGMLRHKEKVHALRAVEEYHKYERAAYEHFMLIGGDRYALWQDLIGRAAVKMEPDVMKLHYAIKQKIDREGVGRSAVLAQIQTGLALVTLATLLFDTMMTTYQRQTMIDITSSFRAGRITAVESNWREVGELTGRQVMKDVNLRDDPTCQLAVRVILTRYQQADILNEAAGEALRLNPEAWKYASEEDLEVIGK